MVEFFTLIAIIALGSCAMTAAQSVKNNPRMFDHLDKPYCQESVAEVRGKKASVKRCWKTVEVESE